MLPSTVGRLGRFRHRWLTSLTFTTTTSHATSNTTQCQINSPEFPVIGPELAPFGVYRKVKSSVELSMIAAMLGKTATANRDERSTIMTIARPNSSRCIKNHQYSAEK